jgi:3-deoxy-D-manno-octulosonate 8-phosphate phosphatase KdsC-like HAD superfamily phosphatase
MSLGHRLETLKIHLFYVGIQNKKMKIIILSNTVICIHDQKLYMSLSFQFAFHIMSIYFFKN